MPGHFHFCHFYLPHATKSDLSSKTILAETLLGLGFKTIVGPGDVCSGASISKKETGDPERHALVLIWAHTFPSPKFLRSWTSRIPAGTKILFNHFPRRFDIPLAFGVRLFATIS